MTSTTSDIAGLVKQLQGLKASDVQDEETRKSLFEAARDVTFTLESPGDSIQRIAYIVRAQGKTYCPCVKLTIISLQSHFRPPLLELLVTSNYSKS